MKIGTLFDARYEIRNVKKGGLGVVYIAFDQEWKEMIAIKTFQNLDVTSSAVKERFIRESTNWINLGHHDNIALAHYYKIVANVPYLFLEYVDGPSFRSIVGTNYPLSAIIAHSIEICKALSYAYNNFRIIHRDIKPDNVFLVRERAGEFNLAKVTDFGLSKVVIPSDFFAGFESALRIQRGALDRTQGVLGTLPYVSPEQILAAEDIDHRSDIYSFGAMLYELTTGSPPFLGIGDVEPEIALLQQHLKHAPVPPRIANSSIPKPLNKLILKCLEKKREHRFSNYQELIDQLSRIYDQIKTDEVKTSQDFHEIVVVPEHSPHALLLNRACSYAEMGNHKEAIALFDQILEKHPHDKVTLCNKGLSLSVMGQIEGAIAVYKEALDVDPSDAETWAMLGVAFKKTQRYDEACVCYDNAIRLAPQSSQYLKDKGQLMNDLAQFEDAIGLFKRATEVSPKDYEAWHELALTSNRLGRPDDAVRFYKKALEVNYSFAYSLDNLGSLLCQLGQMDEGIRYLSEAIKVDAQNPKTWNNLGIAYVHSHEHQKAKACFEKAIQLDPDYQKAKINLQALNSMSTT
jgi:serine/threonine protein kinase/Tfp pilus assembly protein PilF